MENLEFPRLTKKALVETSCDTTVLGKKVVPQYCMQRAEKICQLQVYEVSQGLKGYEVSLQMNV